VDSLAGANGLTLAIPKHAMWGGTVAVIHSPSSNLHKGALHKCIPVEGDDIVAGAEKASEIKMAGRDWSVRYFIKGGGEQENQLQVWPGND
jgi:hypothetical protein